MIRSSVINPRRGQIMLMIGVASFTNVAGGLFPRFDSSLFLPKPEEHIQRDATIVLGKVS
jgi:hypothetical protein